MRSLRQKVESKLTESSHGANSGSWNPASVCLVPSKVKSRSNEKSDATMLGLDGSELGELVERSSSKLNSEGTSGDKSEVVGAVGLMFMSSNKASKLFVMLCGSCSIGMSMEAVTTSLLAIISTVSPLTLIVIAPVVAGLVISDLFCSSAIWYAFIPMLSETVASRASCPSPSVTDTAGRGTTPSQQDDVTSQEGLGHDEAEPPSGYGEVL